MPAERLRPFIKMAHAPKTPIAPGTPALQEHEWGSLSSWPPYPSSSEDQLQVQGGPRGGSNFVDTKGRHEVGGEEFDHDREGGTLPPPCVTKRGTR